MQERGNQSDRYERGEGPGRRCGSEETHTEKFTHHLGSHDFALMHTHTHTLKPITSAPEFTKEPDASERHQRG